MSRVQQETTADARKKRTQDQQPVRAAGSIGSPKFRSQGRSLSAHSRFLLLFPALLASTVANIRNVACNWERGNRTTEMGPNGADAKEGMKRWKSAGSRQKRPDS